MQDHEIVSVKVSILKNIPAEYQLVCPSCLYVRDWIGQFV